MHGNPFSTGIPGLSHHTQVTYLFEQLLYYCGQFSLLVQTALQSNSENMIQVLLSKEPKTQSAFILM